MRFVSATEIRELDQRTIEVFNTPGFVLMERAGRGIATYLDQFLQVMPVRQPSILFLAGKGNNGGDAFVAARYLHQKGYKVHVILAGKEKELRGDSLGALRKMKKIGLRLLPFSGEEIPLADMVVDGLLGTGSRGEPRGMLKDAIDKINRMESIIVSIDIPSGLNCDTGVASNSCVQADFTITLGLPKIGFLHSESRDWTGSIRVVDIGLHDADSSGDKIELISHVKLPRRKAETHKGNYGKIACVGGSPGLSGAIAMAGCAALRSGTGLVSVFCSESQVSLVASHAPELMVFNNDGNMDLNRFDALLIGPGMGREPETKEKIEKMLSAYTSPLVLDADAITAFSGDASALKKTKAPLLITPHPGELAALLDVPISEISAHRLKYALRAASETNAVVLLKGSGTIVADPEGRSAINLTGNPGMATGGSGDVLAGILTSFLGQHWVPYDAACAAVYFHGCAGDSAMLRRTQQRLSATDLINEL